MKNIGDTEDSSQTGYSLLISDLHLCDTRPQISAAFIDFLQNTAAQSSALYILGDLFEYWAGDDAIDDAQYQPIIAALRQLASLGVKLYFMHGNRDFLLSTAFCQTAKITLLPDPCLIHLHGHRTLLSHGDALCTDDVDYQQFRQQVRHAQWQTDFLKLPLATRKAQIESIRLRSEHEKSQKSMQIMDVNQAAVNDLLKTYHYPEWLIHGHTHRPMQHLVQLEGHVSTRWVLGDWYEQGSYLRCDQAGCVAMPLQSG